MATALFVCLHNAGRSQMSAALFERAAGGRHRALSAGTTPAERVHPEVVEVMRELGIDLAGRRPRRLTDELAREADVVVTMGCGDACPYVAGHALPRLGARRPEGPPARRGPRDARRDRAPRGGRSSPSSTRRLARVGGDAGPLLLAGGRGVALEAAAGRDVDAGIHGRLGRRLGRRARARGDHRAHAAEHAQRERADRPSGAAEVAREAERLRRPTRRRGRSR